MRDPKRIDGYLNVIEQIWKTNPDLRFGQLVLNVLRDPSSYYAEDADTLAAFKEVYKPYLNE